MSWGPNEKCPECDDIGFLCAGYGDSGRNQPCQTCQVDLALLNMDTLLKRMELLIERIGAHIDENVAEMNELRCDGAT